MSDPLVPFPRFGAGIGLHRVGAIAADMDIDLAAFGRAGCVITGSNGKGSVAAMTSAILSGAGARVGRFTSPHLFSIRERFAIDGRDIDPQQLETHWARTLATARAYETRNPDDHVGGFEFLFLVAAAYFAAEHCDHTVWEAGIGGRYDPTRRIRAMAGALVSLDLEHTALLGATLEQIAYDKLDAFPEGARVFIGPTPPSLTPRAEAYAALRGLRMTRAPAAEAAPPLAGPHQRANMDIAIALAQTLRPSLTPGEIAAGLAATRWPGRLETLQQDPPVVIDVGHTPDAIAAARAGFHAMHALGILVCGASIDKPADAIIAALAPGFPVIVCAAARHKGRPAAEIAAIARAAAPQSEIVEAASVAEARRIALERAAGRAVYVAGGLFIAAEFRAAHLGADPAQLRFF